MGCTTFLLLFLVVLPPAVLSRVVYMPDNSTSLNVSLEYYLCEGNAESNLTLALTSDQFVSQGSFCLTQSVTDLVIIHLMGLSSIQFTAAMTSAEGKESEDLDFTM